MTNEVKPVEAVGDSPIARIINRLRYYTGQEERSYIIESQPEELTPGIPVDTVELFLDPATIQEVPDAYYLKFLVESPNDQVIVQVLDVDTDEIVRQIPLTGLRGALRDLA